MATAATLLNTPHSEQEWDIYAFNLSQNIDDVRRALLSQKHVNLPQYVLYPFFKDAVEEWLQRLSQALDDICGELSVQSADVQNTNLNDPRELSAWANQIFTEVNQARIILRI